VYFIIHNVEKSVVLIDAENVFKQWKHFCEDYNLKEKLDYQRLVDKLAKNTNLLRAYFYDGTSENVASKKKSFLDALEKKGFQLRTKILKERTFICPSCSNTITKHVQKGVDVSLATDILRHAFQQTCDICIIASGDEDYKDAINVAKDKGIKVWVASFKRALSPEMERAADKVFLIDDFYDEIKRKIY